MDIKNINYATLLPFLHDLELFKLKDRLTKKNPELQKIKIAEKNNDIKANETQNKSEDNKAITNHNF